MEAPHVRWEILRVNATQHQTALLAAHQLRGAFPWKVLQVLLHEKDRVYGWGFKEMLQALGV
ncbi:MAG: hypothetical protein ACI8QS_002463 [Planctomycetota bacterium]